ncbi:hypothetical protein DDQ50_12630 [Amnibacterium flavum]|uniref:Uncharacterized protein n=1 Tax=Amnibacterium flavum TaxID=2173173 RepID=A0A2V1HU20_9MICO|nr:hypothetical protein DDQ50_12630 [Amnibacterium flavum]
MIPLSDLDQALPRGFSLAFVEALYGLQAEGLLGRNLSHGDAEHLKDGYLRGKDRSALQSGIVLAQATPRGIWLFLRAHGYSGTWITTIADPSVRLAMTSDEPIFTVEPWASFVKDLPPEATTAA